ncbi:MAG: hypothetical protein J6S72_07595 [Lachnospiraceae bacterium]|nr:hypothetical protein [Lachnospiraceae bacterium]
MNKQPLLLKTMLASTSSINILRYSDDKKKRSLAIGNIIGLIILVPILGGLIGAQCYGMAYFGMSDVIPALCAVIITAISFLFTLLKAHGLLFGYREYDMLMAMPFPVKTIVSCRFLYMYIKNLFWTLTVSAASLIGYAIVVKPGPAVYILWILLSLLLPVIPMAAAVGISALIGGIGSGFKHKNLVLSILVFILVIPLFFLRFFIDNVIRNDQVEMVLDKSADIFSGIGSRIPTVIWFSDAVNRLSVSGILLLIGVSVIVYEILFTVFAKFYKGINSRLSVGASGHAKVKSKDFKARTVVSSIAYKEFKRFTGSVTYVTNVGMGAVLSAAFGIIILFVNPDKIVSSMAGTPVELGAFSPALIMCVLIYFFTGMVPSTVCSMSLEGNNYWIIRLLPLDMLSVAKGKMLFNILLFLPVSLFAAVTSCISLKAGPAEFAVAILFIVSVNLFSTAFGMRCGVKHMNLDWENEVQVIKQGRAVTAYLLPNMLTTMLIGGGMIALGIIYGILPLLMACLSVVYLLLAGLSYLSVKKQVV